MFYVAQRLDIVHDRGAHVETEHGGKIGRLDPRISAFSFERLNQPRLFATNVGAGAAISINLNAKIRSEDISAKKVFRACFFDGAIEDFGPFRKFASYINVSCSSIKRKTGDQNTLE